MRRGTERWSVGREGRLREGFGGGGMTEWSTSRDPAGRNEREGPGGIEVVADACLHVVDHKSFQRVIPNRARLSHEQSLARKR